MHKLTLTRKTFNTTTGLFYIGVDDLDVVASNVVNAIRMAEIEAENGDEGSMLILPPASTNFSTGSFIDDPLILSSTVASYLKGMFSIWLVPEGQLTFQNILQNILTRFSVIDGKNDILSFLEIINQTITYVPDFTVDRLIKINDVTFEAECILIEITTEPRQPTSVEFSYF